MKGLYVRVNWVNAPAQEGYVMGDVVYTNDGRWCVPVLVEDKIIITEVSSLTILDDEEDDEENDEEEDKEEEEVQRGPWVVTKGDEPFWKDA